MAKIQGQSTSNPAHIAQIAALAALTGPQACVAEMRAAFDQRRIAMVKLLRAIPGVQCREPKGAFYAFPDLSAYVGKKSPEGHILDDDVQLCDWLVEIGKVAVVPGSGFGAPGFVRLSGARSAPARVVDIQHLALTLDVDPAERSVAGTAVLRCRVIAADTRAVELDA